MGRGRCRKPFRQLRRSCTSLYFCTVRLLIVMPSFKSSPRIRSAPHSRFFVAISLIKLTVSGGDPAFDAPGPGSPTPEHSKPLAMPPQDGLGLHNGQGAAPRGQDGGCDEKAEVGRTP